MVVDTPPSRNALDFLEAPGVLARFLDHPVFKLLMLPTRTGLKVLSIASQPILRAIGRVVGSDALADAAAFFQAFAGMEAGFRDRAEAVTAPAARRTTRFVLVASPRTDTVAEAVWFAEQLAAPGFRRRRPSSSTACIRAFGDGIGRRRRPSGRQGRRRRTPDEAALWANLAELARSPTPSGRRSSRSPTASSGAPTRSRSRCCPTTSTTSTASRARAAHLFQR